MDGEKTKRSARARKVWLTLIFPFLIVIALVAWFALTQIENRVRSDMAESLQTVVQATHESLLIWVEYQKSHLAQVTADSEILDLTTRILDVPATPNGLLGSESQSELRRYFIQRRDRFGDVGFFIISPERINLASMRDTNVGATNLIEEQRPELLKRAFEGETVFVPPIRSDVQLRDDSGQLVQQAPTMFVAAPIQDETGRAIAVLTIRLDPARDFSRLTQVGRIGESGGV